MEADKNTCPPSDILAKLTSVTESRDTELVYTTRENTIWIQLRQQFDLRAKWFGWEGSSAPQWCCF
jgi:hypothetical protein